MSPEEIEGLHKNLEKLKEGWQRDIAKYLHHFPAKKPLATVDCQFYLPTCTADNIREDDLMDFLVESIVKYVTESKFLDPEKMKDSSYSTRMYLRAREKFRQKDAKPSEVGELLLFVLLESEGIVQVVQKMQLKTNKNMPLHGADGIHVQVDDGKLLLHFGESKMYKDLGDAIRKSVRSVEDFTDAETGKHKFELDIISTYIDRGKFGEYADLLSDIVLPYSSDKQRLREINSIFIGYNWELLCDLSKKGTTDLTLYLKTEFEKHHEEIVEKIKTAINKSKIKDQHFRVHFIPFTDVDLFRAKFRKAL